jgi:hypothetical protein
MLLPADLRISWVIGQRITVIEAWNFAAGTYVVGSMEGDNVPDARKCQCLLLGSAS